MHPDDKRKAITWAFLQAKHWGYTISEESGVLWVQTGSNEIGCSDVWEFVCFMSDENRLRLAK
jgi:hypothetical protein